MIEHLEAIQNHFKKEYPREGCGVLAVKKGKLHWIPCTNKAASTENFIIDSNEYIKIKNTADIVGIVHSHPDAASTPSEHDIATCNALGIKYYIFSYPDMDLTVLEPNKSVSNLYGREYSFGSADCFEAIRDYYSAHGIEINPREPFEDDWWHTDLDYFSEENVSRWGFKPVDNPEKLDLLVFGIQSTKGNHCGVYLGNEIFYHHAENRLSCRESLHPLWAKNILGVYRYAT